MFVKTNKTVPIHGVALGESAWVFTASRRLLVNWLASRITNALFARVRATGRTCTATMARLGE